MNQRWRAVPPNADRRAEKGQTLRGRRWEHRVLRGGSWNNNARNCHTAYRNRNEPGNRNNNIGFRVVCLLP
jgi:formylglycine-generating enzyme required for sulfatase activity